MSLQSQGNTQSREYLSERRGSISSSESEDSDYPHSSGSSFTSSTVKGGDADSGSGSKQSLMKGLSAYPGPTLNVTITLDKGIFSEHVLNTLNSPEVKEEFCLHAHRIINKLQLDHSPLPVESSDWIMRSIKPATIAFHVNSCSSTDDIFENKWDPHAPRDFRGDNEALSSWHIYHPYLPRRDSPEKQNTSKKDTKGHILAFIPWTTVLTTVLALIGAWSLFHCLVYMLDITPASVWSMLSLIMEILWIFRKFVVSYLFRPLFLKFFLVLINY